MVNWNGFAKLLPLLLAAMQLQKRKRKEVPLWETQFKGGKPELATHIVRRLMPFLSAG